MNCKLCDKEIKPLGMASHIKNCVGKRHCKFCGIQIINRNKLFCSSKCSNEYQTGDRGKCLFCENRLPRNHTHYCNLDCKKNYERVKPKTTLSKYRTASSFKFALSDYPDEFDFGLIKKYGWYSPSNKKNNLGGVSRDHIYSVSDGFKNGIDPGIISHPANCRLIRHNDNISKNSKSEISLEELLLKIEKWNLKYN